MKNWYFNRLMTMSAAEVFYRLKGFLKGFLEERYGIRKSFDSKAAVPARDILDIRSLEPAKFPAGFKIFGRDFDFSNPAEINWHKDIFSGESFGLSFYRKINIIKNPLLSAKCVWEVNRLQFLTGICLNYRIMNNKSDLDLFMRIIKAWSLHNPYLTGVNWYSNIEINLRLITWFLCWEILDAGELMLKNDLFRKFIQDDWLPLIRMHCLYSSQHPSKYSSANNHLVSEYAGLFIASSKWEFEESDNWISYSQRGLEREIMRQNSKAGINKEEAAEYIQFITDFFLLSFIVGEKTSRPFSETFREQLYKIFCYIHDFLDCRGNFPKYGDEDDGKCFILDFDDKYNNFKSLLTSGAIIFRDPVLKSKSNGFDIKNQLLFGGQGRLVYESLPALSSEEGSKFFSEEGHFIFRKTGTEQEIYMHFDAAPLGYLSIAAHGHSDALSFVLNVDGEPVFTDSGTYTYHTDPEWRQYFIGTLAHNTVRINQKNQAVNGGPTLWIRHYNTSVLDQALNGDHERVRAVHDGYSGDNARHIREIVFDRINNEFQIADTIVLSKKKKIQVEIPFHLHPCALITGIAPGLFRISCGQARLVEFTVDDTLHPVIVKGQTEPQILGWYSGSFLAKEPASVIYCKTHIEQTTTFRFKIKII